MEVGCSLQAPPRINHIRISQVMIPASINGIGPRKSKSRRSTGLEGPLQVTHLEVENPSGNSSSGMDSKGKRRNMLWAGREQKKNKMCEEKRCCGVGRDVIKEKKRRNCSTENSPFYPCISKNPTASAALRKREKMFIPLCPSFPRTFSVQPLL